MEGASDGAMLGDDWASVSFYSGSEFVSDMRKAIANSTAPCMCADREGNSERFEALLENAFAKVKIGTESDQIETTLRRIERGVEEGEEDDDDGDEDEDDDDDDDDGDEDEDEEEDDDDEDYSSEISELEEGEDGEEIDEEALENELVADDD